MRVHPGRQEPPTLREPSGRGRHLRQASAVTLFLLSVPTGRLVAQEAQLPTDLGDLGECRAAQAILIDDVGSIVGVAQAASAPTGAAPVMSPFLKASGRALRAIDIGSSSSHFQPVAMNARGVVVGTVVSGQTVTGSMTWSAARGHEEIPAPPEYERPVVRDIDDAGNILLTATQEDYNTPFLLSSSGVFTEIACPEDRECTPTAMNEAGMLVGYTADGLRQDLVVWARPSDAPRALATPAAVWDPVAVDINADGVIIGNATMQDSVRPSTALLVWTAQQEVARMVPNSIGHALSDRGVIAGATWAQGRGLANASACLWNAADGGKVVLRGFAPELRSEAFDVNAAGTVVGAATDATGASRAVVFASPR